jgi:hypothetical protein
MQYGRERHDFALKIMNFALLSARWYASGRYAPASKVAASRI